ncbi:hypothetical protein AGIG_G7771 [Arapaima gigas]
MHSSAAVLLLLPPRCSALKLQKRRERSKCPSGRRHSGGRCKAAERCCCLVRRHRLPANARLLGGKRPWCWWPTVCHKSGMRRRVSTPGADVSAPRYVSRRHTPLPRADK